MTKKLFINGRFLTPQKTGVQRYALEIVTKLDELITQKKINQNHEVEIICLVPPNTTDQPNWKNIKIEETGHLQGNLWEQISLPLRVGKELLFSPTNIGPFFTRNQVITIHDASVFAFADTYSFLFRTKYQTFFRFAALTNKRVITVSEFSKEELKKYCFKKGQQITVTHPGHDHINAIREEAASLEEIKEICDTPYFIVVGSQSQHKNYKLLYEAMSQIEDPQFQILIVGGNFPAVFHGQQPLEHKNIQVLGYIADKYLSGLYHHATAAILPSKYEGFGFPVIEALSVNVPVICSSIPPFKEIGNGFVTFFDPDSPAELASLMQQPVMKPDPQAVKEYLQEQFSWEKAGLQTWEVLQSELFG